MSAGPDVHATEGPWHGSPLATSVLERPSVDLRLPALPPVSLLLGVPVDVLTMLEALDRITELVRSGRASGRSHQVVTVNVDFLINASQSASLRWILRRSELAIADGMPLLWASRLLGVRLPERVPGADLLPLLAQRSEQHGFSMLLFGGAPGVADAAASVLRGRHPGLQLAAVAAPFLDTPEDTSPELLDLIRRHRPDIMCVALGHPKQDRWIARFGPSLGVPVMIGVGGSLDFLAGTTKRAPRWMQAAGLEWLHRLVHEPRRLASRYGRDLVHFGPRIAAQRLLRPPSHALDGPAGGASVVDAVTVTVVHHDGGSTVMEVGSAEFHSAAGTGVHALIDLDQLGWPTWERLLFVVAVARLLQRHGGDLLALESPTSELWWAWRRHIDGLITVAPKVAAAKALATSDAVTSRAGLGIDGGLRRTEPRHEDARQDRTQR